MEPTVAAKEEDLENLCEERMLLHNAGKPIRNGHAQRILLLISTHIATAIIVLVAREPSLLFRGGPAWSSSISQQTHVAKFNPFEGPNAFTAAPDEVGDAVEERWTDLGIWTKSMLIPVDNGPEYGLDPKKHVIHDPLQESGVPYAGYPVVMEVLHQLHCVNLLRQGLYYNYNYYRKSNHRSWKHDQDSVIEIHLAHCVDSLRQFIMCEADTGFHPFLQPSGDKGDFARKKGCKSFESAREFAIKHQWLNAEDFWVDERHQNYTMTLESRWSAESRWTGH